MQLNDLGMFLGDFTIFRLISHNPWIREFTFQLQAFFTEIVKLLKQKKLGIFAYL